MFEPVYLADFEVIKAIAQPVCALMAADHPLAVKPDLRLRDCLTVPHVIPSRDYGVRHLLEAATRDRSHHLDPVVEADSFEMMREYVLHEHVVSFQIPIGLLPARDPRLVVRELPARDLPAGLLLLGQMRGRALPVASAKFAVQLTAALEAIELLVTAEEGRKTEDQALQNRGHPHTFLPSAFFSGLLGRRSGAERQAAQAPQLENARRGTRRIAPEGS